MKFHQYLNLALGIIRKARSINRVPRGALPLYGAAIGMVFALGTIDFHLHGAETPEQAVERAYGPQIAKVKITPETIDDKALAENLVKDAEAMKKEPAMQGALLLRALTLAVEDSESGGLAKSILTSLVETKALTEENAWKELTKLAKDALVRRNLGKADRMLTYYTDWKFQLIRLAMEAHDVNGANRQLADFMNELRGFKLKYELEWARLIQERIRFEAPFWTAATNARAKAGGGNTPLKISDDPKINLAAGETILAQTGDWIDAAPYLVRSKDTTWALILRLHYLRKAANRSPANKLLPYPLNLSLVANNDQAMLALALEGKSHSGSTRNIEPGAPLKEKRTLPIMPKGMTQDDLDNMPQARYEALKEALEHRSDPKDEQPLPPIKDRKLPILPANMTQADIDKMTDKQFESLRRAIEKSFTREEIEQMQDPASDVGLNSLNVISPPAEVTAIQILEAANYLETLLAPARRSSPVGKIALYREVTALLAQAHSANQEGMTAGQKLDLVTRHRSTLEATDKAIAELTAAFDRAARVRWVNLSSGNMKVDWASSTGYAGWRALEGGVLESKDGTWDNKLRSQQVKFADFIFEFEFLNETTNAHPILFFREHSGPPYYQLEFTATHTFFSFRPNVTSRNSDLLNHPTPISAKVWTPVRVVADEDHLMVWVNNKLVIDMVGMGHLDAGSICLIGLDGTTKYRNIRIRELK